MLPAGATGGAPPQQPLTDSPNKPSYIPSTDRYMCLANNCYFSASYWAPVRLHMRNACRVPGKPIMGDCSTKCELVRAQLHTKKSEPSGAMAAPSEGAEASSSTQGATGNAPEFDPFRGRLKTRFPPSEQQLVQIINKALRRGKPLAHILASTIRPMFGDFHFNAFGFGTFSQFCQRHFPSVPFKQHHQQRQNR